MSLTSSRIPGLNDALQIGECMSNEKKISPVWLRVSTTPWEISSKKICGYGRPIKNISISDQMPAEFKRTEHMTRPPDFEVLKRKPASRKPNLEAAYVLPGGLNLMASEQPPHARNIKKYYYQNQVIMEPQLTGRPNDCVRTKFDPPISSYRAPGAPKQAPSIPMSPIVKSKPPQRQSQPQTQPPQAGGNTVVINSSRPIGHSLGTARARIGASNLRSTGRFASSARSSLQA